MARRYAFALPAAALLALAGCNTGTPAPTDGGVDAASLPDATYLPPDSCDMTNLHVLDGMAGGTVSLDFDTTMTTSRPRDLGPACGNPASDIRWAPQEIVEFHVPGTGMQGVRISTDSPSTTPINLNTVIQVRTGECRAIPTTSFPPTCFDDVSAANLLSTGGLTVMGGTTLYVIVTGYSNPPAGEMAVDRGHIHVDFSVAPNTPPTLTSGSGLFTGDDTLVIATGTDPDGPIAGFFMTLYNASGGLDTNGDGRFDDGDAFQFPFDSVMASAPSYTGQTLISGTNAAWNGYVYGFAAACRQAGVACTQFGLRAYDQQYALSPELRVDVHEAVDTGVGGACDVSHICVTGLTCTAGTCAATAAATGACGSAMDITIATPTDASTMAEVSGTTSAAASVFAGSCGGENGRANIWHVTVPAGDYDLQLTTDVAGTTGDTLMYIRSVCVDATTELPMGCNDDINYPSNPHSRLSFRDIAPGDYFVFMESYDGSAVAYHLQATLLPVLASGATCDPALVNYRCATGVCGASTHVCP